MKGKKTKDSNMHDLLLPLLLVIGVLPLLVHLAVYSCGYSQYDWYYTNDVLADFYCYYKSYFLDIIAFFSCVVLAFAAALYRERMKSVKPFVPLFLYCGFVLLATICSVNRTASLEGNFESFESCFVLISYVVMCLYAYEFVRDETDCRILWHAVLWLCGAFFLVGAFQVWGHDLMDFAWVQRLVMSSDDYAAYRGEVETIFTGNYVYLTLYNPNYAGVVLNMLFAVVFFMFVTEREQVPGICEAIFSALLFVLIWFTYARAALLTLAVTAVLALVWARRLHGGGSSAAGSRILLIAAGAGAVVALLVCVDAAFGFRFLSRFAEKNDREPLESMVTDKEGIHIRYDERDYRICIEKETLVCLNERTDERLSAPEGETLALPVGEGNRAVLYLQDEPVILLDLADTMLTFVVEDGIYYYQNGAGKNNQMVPVSAVDLHGLEYLGSARGYIWSRVLPLLPRYLAVGSGPDTFAEVFPQNDFVGKIVYADNPDRVIEKAHNDYLTKWVQTGFLSVLCIVSFYILLLRMCRKGYRKACRAAADEPVHSLRLRLGLGCYIACIGYMLTSLFNDSTIQSAPIFWVAAGIAMSGAAQEVTIH